MAMVSAERIPVSEKENDAIDKLLKKHPGQNATMTRRDPGETGPVLVQLGADTYEISKAGKATKKGG